MYKLQWERTLNALRNIISENMFDRFFANATLISLSENGARL